MKPYGNRLFAQPLTTEHKNESGLQLSVKLKKAKVLFVGDKCFCKPNDIILYQDGSGISYTHNEIDGLLLQDFEILSII